ncbi:POTRA domain-containing protein [Natronoflexus pectinivorans]|uniref:Surface antigen-like variable number repeat protein n=1 Tax=Natronoflexus pectinivorans TaxID=682526 RepID=A0A4R2GMG0_9BACT|nr:POTRA domain-containing protein [Natronoflexus pectinivorans]TCO10403.1 surface antigen-like variable number repeat protein [Natronoflexus pectinivorans]
MGWKCADIYFGLIIAIFLYSIPASAGIEVQSSYDEYRQVSSIYISGNHSTREITILTELPFETGNLIKEKDILALARRAEQNLLNTSLFNFVEIDVIYPDRRTVSFHIDVEERWYIWAFPVFEQEGRNFSDFLRINDGSHFNYGVYLKHDNFRGRNETLKLRMVTGYRSQVLFEFKKPGFNQQSGWGFSAGWLSYDQTAYNTMYDKQVFIKTSGSRLLRQSTFEFNYFYRHQLDHHHQITVTYENLNAADTLRKINPDFLPSNSNNNQSIDAEYKYKYDRRDSKIYPLRGNKYQFSFARRGFSVDNGYEGFFQTTATASFQYPLTNRIFAGSKTHLSAIDKDQVPYVFRTGLGYREYLNGFEYRVIDGASYGYVQNRLLYEIIPRTERNINWIPVSQFSRVHYALYFRLHFDAGYVLNDRAISYNQMANSLLMGYGFGFDMVTFYDKILSLNYSFNNFGEHGIFVHFNLSM